MIHSTTYRPSLVVVLDIDDVPQPYQIEMFLRKPTSIHIYYLIMSQFLSMHKLYFLLHLVSHIV